VPRLPRPRPADILVILISAAATAASAWAVAGRRGAETLLVSAGGREYAYPLDRDARLEFDGPLGTTVVSVEKGAARVVSSPCENQLCVSSGAVSRRGQWIACLPNAVLLRVGGASADVDAGTY